MNVGEILITVTSMRTALTLMEASTVHAIPAMKEMESIAQVHNYIRSVICWLLPV